MQKTKIKQKRVTFELPEKLARRLKVMAAEVGTSQTSIVRRAIERELKDMTAVVDKIEQIITESTGTKEKKP